MSYKIVKEENVYKDYLKIRKASIERSSYNKDTVTFTRETLAHGDAIAILIYEKDSNSFLLTKQFRYPTSINGDSWMTEIPAGMVDKGEKPEDTAKRETMEELGYEIKEVTQIGTYYSSPGSSTERVYMYFAEVTSNDKIATGGGLDTEHEDIELIKVPVSEAKEFMRTVNDFKTMIGFQWYFLNKEV
ncbi:NUDIX hydrolase [Neptunitalea chrysea]|uniref:GDP-mannose pyrophosphatase n=1 Tax=Neptunitalea chrysea TaxID=1647581 RepID=A0A9W6B6H5_9FLAO|nr:NUDIX hydrolase [Neptunitalea chrysea]GLB53746.1 NUDIX hydrolase [Neptunitalea chrysea]